MELNKQELRVPINHFEGNYVCDRATLDELRAALTHLQADRLGAVQNPMLPIYRAREISFIAGQTGCKLLITPSVWNNFDYASLAEQILQLMTDYDRVREARSASWRCCSARSAKVRPRRHSA